MNWLLLPFALLFGLLVRARNYLYDINFLHSKSYKVPVIIIGNLTVGGTGKTPHVEYLVEYLKDNYRITTLSRGYKRKTKGYIEATAQSTANQIGDEPLQIKLKYPEIQVVVDENRTHAIDYLINQPLKPEVIILDDAYQHRKVKGSLNIVLIDYNRPVYNDFYLPMGRLRETKSALKRAHTIIITKCPEKISIDKQHEIIKKLKLKDHQGIYFTRMDYGKLTPLFNKIEDNKPEKDKLRDVVVFTGIAQPKPFLTYLEQHGIILNKHIFPDHYSFSKIDIQKIVDDYKALNNPDAIIICTEKDAVRLQSDDFKAILSSVPVFYLPIKVSFLNNSQKAFNKEVIELIKAMNH